MKNSFELRLWNNLEELLVLQEKLTTFYTLHSWTKDLTQEIDLILEEWIVNIIKHAYPKTEKHPIDLKLNLVEGELVIEIQDMGYPFNPLTWKTADTASALEERPLGGLGIHLIKKLSDRLEYFYKAPKNILIIKKKIPNQV